MKIKYLTNQRGNLLMVLSVVMLIMIASVSLFDYLSTVNQSLGYATLKERIHHISTKVFFGIKDKLNKHLNEATCIDTTRFFRFSKMDTFDLENSILKIDKAKLQACGFLNDYDSTLATEINVEMVPVPSDNDAHLGRTQVQISLHIKAKPAALAPAVELREVKRYQIRVADLSYFGLVAYDFNTTHLFAPLSTNSKLTVLSRVFLDKSDGVIKLEDLTTEDLFTGVKPKLRFVDNVISNAKSLELPNDPQNILSIDALMTEILPGGLRLNELIGKTLPYQMTKNDEWKQGLDYQYLYLPSGNEKKGIALPAAAGFVSGYNYDDHSKSTLANAGNGIVNQLPKPGIISDLSLTCKKFEPTEDIENTPMVLYRRDSVVELSLDAIKPVFCGLIIAQKLRVKIPDGKKSFLVGSFWVNNIEIEGQGELMIINPLSYRFAPAELTATYAVDLDNIARQFIMLRGYYGYNFFVPIYNTDLSTSMTSNPVEFLPRRFDYVDETSPLAFYHECEPGSAATAYKYCWKDILAPKFDALLDASHALNSQLHFFVEEAL